MLAEQKLRVALIFGGRSGEHEVSLQSARSVLGVMDPALYDVFQIGITHDGTWLVGGQVLQAMMDSATEGWASGAILPAPSMNSLFKLHSAQAGPYLELLSQIDVVFPLLHGTFGEDGTLQGLLEMADLAYVGAGVLGSALAMDKGVFHAVMRAQGIPVVETLVLLRSEIEADMQTAMQKAETVAPFPLFIKPANLGSSVGISKCTSRADLLEGLMEACRFDRRILVQRGVNAREIEVSVLGNDHPQASVPGEVLPSREFYSYEAKYIDNSSSLLIPAPIPDATIELARRLAVQAYQAVDCAGMARVDFLLDRDTGELYLNELNTIPGFTQISMYPKLWEASGLPYPALVRKLIDLALERKADRDRIEHRYQS